MTSNQSVDGAFAQDELWLGRQGLANIQRLLGTHASEAFEWVMHLDERRLRCILGYIETVGDAGEQEDAFRNSTALVELDAAAESFTEHILERQALSSAQYLVSMMKSHNGIVSDYGNGSWRTAPSSKETVRFVAYLLLASLPYVPTPRAAHAEKSSESVEEAILYALHGREVSYETFIDIRDRYLDGEDILNIADADGSRPLSQQQMLSQIADFLWRTFDRHVPSEDEISNSTAKMVEVSTSWRTFETYIDESGAQRFKPNGVIKALAAGAEARLGSAESNPVLALAGRYASGEFSTEDWFDFLAATGYIVEDLMSHPDFTHIDLHNPLWS